MSKKYAILDFDKITFTCSYEDYVYFLILVSINVYFIPRKLNSKEI